MASSVQTVPARRGAATLVKADQKIKITNTHGNQVVDTWAIALPSSVLTAASSKIEAPLYPNATSDSPSKIQVPAYMTLWLQHVIDGGTVSWASTVTTNLVQTTSGTLWKS